MRKYLWLKRGASIIAAIDKKVFNSRIRSIYYKHKGKRDHLIASVDLFLMQKEKEEYNNWDMAVRWLAIEEYYGKNNIGVELYKKMHLLRGNYSPERKSEENFFHLIEKIEKEGLRPEYAFPVDCKYVLMGGSHRTTLAIYKDIEFVSVYIKDYNNTIHRDYGKKWFWEKGFSKDEISLIKETHDKMVRICKERIGLFSCVIYPPAHHYFREILHYLAEYAPDNVTVEGYKTIEFTEKELISFIHAIYFFDGISAEHIIEKVQYILHASRSSGIIGDTYPMMLVDLSIKEIDYYIYGRNKMPRARNIEDMKKVIRERIRAKEAYFNEKLLGDYTRDVIMHSTDSYYSNKACRLILALDRDMTALKESLAPYGIILPDRFEWGDVFSLQIANYRLDEIKSLLSLYLAERCTDEWFSLKETSDDFILKMRDYDILRFKIVNIGFGK